MSTTFDERADLVQRLTIAFHRSPRLYRVRVMLWIALGYLIIGVLLAISLALSAGVVALIVWTRVWAAAKFVWIPFVFSWMLIRSLYVRLDPPDGRRLQRREAPRLFAMIDEIRERLGIGPIRSVLLIYDMNAAIVETPRFGGFFGWRRHLMIGLPMLLVHPVEEIQAILAHELGHLSGKHGRVSAWSWRVRVTWARVLESLEHQRDFGSRTLKRLVHWYFDRMMPVTLVQARTQEHAADQFAAEIAGKETAARALAWSAVATTLIDERFWTPLWDRVDEMPDPPRNPIDDLTRRRAEFLAPPYDEALSTELAKATALDDTHPALRERLQRIGHARPALALSASSAAETLLGRTTSALIAECDQAWREGVTPLWRERHKELQQSHKELADTTDDVSSLDDERKHKRAQSLAELGRNDEALAIYEHLATNPADARAAFHMGRILVQRGDLSGIDHLSRAMENDWQLVLPSCDLAYEALRKRGRERDAEAWSERARQQYENIADAQAEAGRIDANDELLPTNLPDETQQQIVSLCTSAGWIKNVWIARKSLTRVPATVNFVAVSARALRMASDSKLKQLAESIHYEDEPLMVFVANGSLARRLDQIPSARKM